MLYDATINGETRKVVGNFSRNGFYYTLDRASGQFLRADQYQEKVTWTKGIDPKTGKPADYDPNSDVQLYAGIGTLRNKRGPGGVPVVERFADVLPADLRRQAADRLCVRRRRLHRGLHHQGADGREEGLGRPAHVLPGSGHAPTAHGALWALDVRTGKIVGKTQFPIPNQSGMLSTGGDLLFTGHSTGAWPPTMPTPSRSCGASASARRSPPRR